MLTSQDVHSVQFEKSFRGYRIEEVDHFLDRIEEQLKSSADEIERMQQQIQQLQADNQRLAKETEDYRADGEIMKSALINAQRIGENVIRETNQKAEEIIHKANIRSDDIIRDANDLLQKATDRADEIVREASDQRMLEEREYERVRLEVTRFKADVLNLYRSHVESLSRLPEYTPDAPAEQSQEGAAEETESPAEAPAADAAADQAEETDADQQAADQSEDFWNKDESQLKTPEQKQPAEVDYSAFQGVQFSK